MSGHGNDFKKWIEAGYKNYGKDPWFFIRELAQNSRDAGASSIGVRIGYSADQEEVLVFEDDGKGMSYSDAKHYLFRLYASSKTTDKHSAGMFGIGFWTVLKFNPTSIIIESSQGKGKGSARSWGVNVTVGDELGTENIDSSLNSRGTRITLIRPAAEKTEKDFFNKTRSALERYCSYLRRNDNKGTHLPVHFGNRNITRQMHLPGPVALYFKDGPVEGAVGLAPKPRVQLYARGLPVWEGTTLEELSHTPPKESKNRQLGQGLAPVIILNGNRLEVNISRRKVIDNRHLQQVRKSAEKALSRMVQTAADSLSPRSMPRRAWERLKFLLSGKSLPSFWKILLLLLVVIVPLEIFLLKSLFNLQLPVSSDAIPIRTLSIRADTGVYLGASVRTAPSDSRTGFSYQPPEDRWFSFFYADRYSIGTGFMQQPSGLNVSPPPAVRSDCQQSGFTVQLNTSGSGPIYLPQPPGFFIDPDSIRIDGLPISPDALEYRSSGETVLAVSKPAAVDYRCCPQDKRSIMKFARRMKAQLTTLPDQFNFPPGISSALSQVDGETSRKVIAALRMTRSLLKYDDSPETAKKYTESSSKRRNKSGSGRDWFQKVTDIGVGDCDILNGVTVLFLRKMGVPARLVIGGVGRGGEILPVWHAWTEYYETDGKHRVVDASEYVHRLTLPGRSQQGRRMRLSRNTPRDIAGSVEQRQPGQPGHRISETILTVLAIVILFLFVLMVFLLSRLGKPGAGLSQQVLERVEKDLAGMALHALLHPNQGAWGSSSGIRKFKLIPSLNSAPVSMQEALKLADQQKLYSASPENPIIAFLESSSKRVSTPILNTGNRSFRPLIKLLPGVVDLDRVTELKTQNPEDAAASWIGKLVTAVNHLLKGLKLAAMPPCLLASAELSGDFFDVDLSPLPKLPPWLMPNRFIAVNPYSRNINALAALFQTNESLAQFRFVRILVDQSKLVPLPSVTILQACSRYLLRHIDEAHNLEERENLQTWKLETQSQGVGDMETSATRLEHEEVEF